MQPRQSHTAGQRGFTLIELMIVIMVVGILVGIALPGYQDSVRKSRRSAAQAAMLDIANRQQQFMLANRVYAADFTTLRYSVPTEVSERYTCSLSVNNAATPPTFLVGCIPTSQQATSSFQTLRLNNQGAKTPSGEW